MLPPLDDTIAAIATAPGAGGLAVLRVSGARALSVADVVFRGAAPLASAASHTLHHGWAVDGASARLDEVVAGVFRTPRSYTREDVVELTCHGGALPARGILAALVAAGARLAGPGEFTLRAFVHGRLDLAQAEAVADLIASESDAARRLALSQLAGGLSRRLAALSDRVADAAAEVEARVDFAEDVGGVEVPEHVVQAIAAAAAELDALLEGQPWARALAGGAHVPLVGRPNAGKSSLFNRLVGEDRAIVTHVPGTTRDRVSETALLGGVRVTFSDTAGLRDTADPVEAIGVARAREALAESHAVILVVDGTALPGAGDRELVESLGDRPVVLALAKSDLPAALDPAAAAGRLGVPERGAVPVSAVSGEGLDALRGALLAALGQPLGATAECSVTSARHAEALGRARAALARAADAAAAGRPGEIVALELHAALAAVGEVRGTDVGPDLLERIFSRFCIGK
jgi:tRNA modification GTPase